MNYASFFSRSAFAPEAPPPATRFGAEQAQYVADLIAALLTHAASTGDFREVMAADPNLSVTKDAFGADEAERADYGLSAYATASGAAITVAGADAGRLAFLGFGPLHKRVNGYNPDWDFDDPGADMTARCRILGLEIEVACISEPGGAATIILRTLG